MKSRRIIFLLMAMGMCLMAGCEKEKEIDLCNSVVREYLNAETENKQAEILVENSGVSLASQNPTQFSWNGDGSDIYSVYFADNKEYVDAYVYETTEENVTPDGVFVPGKTYYWMVESGSNGDIIHRGEFKTKAEPVRYITTTEVPNVRDLGGWKTETGKSVKYEMLYRGGITNPGNDNNFPEQDATLFSNILGIRTEIDLRTPNKDDRNQTVSILGVGASYCKLPISQYSAILPNSAKYDSKSIQSIRKIFQVLADENNYPIYIHCNAGADRTGTIVYLINGLLGVSYEDLTRDFELTSFSTSGRRWRSDIVDGTHFDESGVMQDDSENYIAWGDMHQLIQQNYMQEGETLADAIEKYLIEICGVQQAEIESLRSIMLEN